MRKIFNWVIAATLICGASVLASCSDNSDNPVDPKPVVSPDRQAFEEVLSTTLQKSAEQIRFDAVKQSLTTLGDFILGIDEQALSEQIIELIPKVLENSAQMQFNELNEEDYKAVSAALNERFDMTDDDIKTASFFALVDAYNTLGKMKVTFENGKATKSENDGFCIENIDKDGKSSSITLNFADERDGVRFFVSRLFKLTPICIQLPKQIGIIVKSASGVQMAGTIYLDTDAPSKYISFKNSMWTGICSLTSDYYGRFETVEGVIHHGSDRAFHLGADFAIDGVEKAALTITGMNKPYSDEYINSEELKSLRDCGAFFSAAYDVLKAINGSEVENVEFTLGGKLVFNAKVDDVAACLLALGNIRKLHGTKPGYEAIDEYTKILNDHFHYTVSLKDTDVKAQGSLATVMKNFEESEYQPAIALQFAGEPKPMVLMDRMSDQDKANYKKIMDNINDLAQYASETLVKIKDKFSNFKVF